MFSGNQMQSLREESPKVFSMDKKTTAHTQKERIRECISSFSFGHRNKTGGDTQVPTGCADLHGSS